MSEAQSEKKGRRGGRGPAVATEAPPQVDEPRAVKTKVHVHERSGFIKFRIWNEETPAHLRDVDSYASTFNGRVEELRNGVWNVLPVGFYSNVADSTIVAQTQNPAPAADPQPGVPYSTTRGTNVPRFRLDVEPLTDAELRAAIAKYGAQA